MPYRNRGEDEANLIPRVYTDHLVEALVLLHTSMLVLGALVTVREVGTVVFGSSAAVNNHQDTRSSSHQHVFTASQP
ncbi:hypothetical protein IG631_24053 [Alternaria alternata]|nr:hypothetical protein IG631_24053 [Alternaria alternata]